MTAPRRSLLRTVSSISGATAMSRVLGLVRDQVQSYYFGAGVVTDAFIAAFRIPNLLRDLFAEGALSAAFVPTFTREREHHGEEAAFRLGNRLMTALALLLGGLALVIVLGAPWILPFYAPGFSGEKLTLAITMTRIVSPFLLFVALAAVAMGMLNAGGRFFVPALAPVFFNVAVIAGVIGLVPLLSRVGVHPGLALAIGAIVGGALQFLVQLPALRGEGFRFRADLAPRDPGLRRIGRLMLPATFGLAATQVNILVDTILASRYDSAITWLSLAFRLMLLPIGLFGVAIATANLARVSHDAARDDLDGLRANVGAALRMAALLTVPATAGLIALREPIVRVLLEHGRFGAHDTLQTAAAVLCYGLGLYAYAVTKIQVPTFYALGNTRLPVIASATAVGLKIVTSLTLIVLLPRIGVDAFLGLALSTALAAWTNFGVLAYGLRRKIGALRGSNVVTLTLGISGIAALMGLACRSLHAALEGALPGGGLGGEIGRLAVCVLAGIALFGVAALATGVPEARAALAALRRRPPGSGDR